MPKSKNNDRKHNIFCAEDCLVLNKKNVKQLLKHEKNVLNVNRSIQKLEICKDSCSVKNKLSKMTEQNWHEIYNLSCSVVLDKLFETAPHKSPKRALRSSSRQKMMQSKEVAVADKNTSHCRSKKQQSVSDRKISRLSEIAPLESLCKRPSFYRRSLTVQCNGKSHGQNELSCSTVLDIPNVHQDSPQRAKRSSRQSMKLRSVELSEKMSDKIQVPIASKAKHVKSNTNIIKQQKAKEKVARHMKKPFKHPSSAQFLKNRPTAKKKRYVRKSSVKLQMAVRSKSYSGVIPVDDLALSPLPSRKTKSDGFKFPGRNTLKRKRLIIDAMKSADAEYEDDIFDKNEFNNFSQILPDLSESEMSCSITTPKLGCQLTPLIRHKTPAYKDCFSPREYALSRKIAEEYLYRNKKRKNYSKVETRGVPEKKKLEFSEVVEGACKVQKEVEKLVADESDLEDNYFTDCE